MKELQEFLKSSFNSLSTDDPFYTLKAKAWDLFQFQGLPTSQDELYRSISLKNFNSQTFSEEEKGASFDPSLVYPECQNSYLVFINGNYQPEISNLSALKRVDCVSLSEGFQKYKSFFLSNWQKMIKEEIDPFASLNAALHKTGAFLYIPPKANIDTPIQIINLVDVQKNALLIPRLQIFVGASSSVSFVSSLHVHSSSSINSVTDLTIEENASVSFTQSAFKDNAPFYLFDAFRAHLKKDSSLHVVNLSESISSRFDYRVALTGENSSASLNGYWMLSKKEESHINILIDHQAPHCRSNQAFKGVLNDVSKSSFQGKILVRQAAQKTEAFQLNNNILLSDYARADTKPNLEIFADDVKASHGATIGQLNQEELFYMKTRGFSSNAAKAMLTHSFVKEIIDQIPLKSLQQKAINSSKNYLLS